jgi:hypothetical protein
LKFLETPIMPQSESGKIFLKLAFFQSAGQDLTGRASRL